jgi:hypothetical protein
MKRNKFCMAAILLAVSLFASASANALTEAQTADIKKTIARTPALELTPAAQRIIRAAKSDEKAEVALAVVRAALAKNARVAVALTKAVTKEVPQIAAQVAAIAAQFNPSEAVEITRVACVNAPKDADQIAVAVAKVSPKSAAKVAKAAVASSPSIAPSIVRGVSEAVPTAQAAIEKDATIRIVSAFAQMTQIGANDLARLTQDSATHGGIHGTITIRPGGIVFTPGDEPLEIDAADAVVEARSAQFVQFLQTINALELRTDLNDAQRSAIANAIVLVANEVVTDFGVPKSEQNGTFTATTSSLNDLLTSFPAGGDPKKDAAVDLLLGVTAIVTDPETPGDQQVSLVNFIAGQIGTTLSQGVANGLTTNEIKEIVDFVVKEVRDTVVNSTTTLTQAELGTLLIEVTGTVQTSIDKYASPGEQ